MPIYNQSTRMLQSTALRKVITEVSEPSWGTEKKKAKDNRSYTEQIRAETIALFGVTPEEQKRLEGVNGRVI
jgi:hypothetical protein